MGKETPPATGTRKESVEVPNGYRDPLPFAFKKGDTVAILGNGLADRMQHDGWTETFLQSGLKVRMYLSAICLFRETALTNTQEAGDLPLWINTFSMLRLMLYLPCLDTMNPSQALKVPMDIRNF